MNIYLKAKTEAGRKGLKNMILETRTRRARLFVTTVILEEEPYTVSIMFKQIPNALTDDEITHKTLVNGLKDQLEKDYNITEQDIEVTT